MKKIILLLFGVTISIAAVRSQSPTPEPDTLKDPIRQTDPEIKTLPPDINYTEDHVKIMPQQIPAAVKQTLESSSTYQGWERATLYKHKSGNKFIVEITKGDTTRVFRFDKTGKPLIE